MWGESTVGSVKCTNLIAFVADATVFLTGVAKLMKTIEKIGSDSGCQNSIHSVVYGLICSLPSCGPTSLKM